MPIFHFVYHEGDGPPLDVVEVEYVDGEAALYAAVQAARDTIHDAIVSSIDPSKALIHVYDDTSRLVGTIRASDILRPPPSE